jgi:O-antigen/teichoic acid export membrane protein
VAGKTSSLDATQTGGASDLASVARQLSVTLASSVAGSVIGLCLTLVVTRGLGATEAGMFFVTIALLAVCTTVLTLGADLGAMRMIARQLALGETKAVKPTILAGTIPVAAVGTVSALIMFALAETFVPHLIRDASPEEAVSLFRVIILFLPFAAITTVLLAATRGFETMTPFVVTEVGTALLSTLAISLAIGLGTSLTVAGAAWAMPIPLALAYVALMLRRLAKDLPGSGFIRVPAAIWREFWAFASVRGVAAVFQVLVRYLDVILVAAISSARDAGIYAAVSRLALVGMVAQRAIIRVTGPRFSGLLAVGDHDRAQTLYGTTTGWLVSLGFPFYLLMAIFSPVIVLIFGSEFESGAIPLTILSIAMLVNVATGPSTTILLMAGRASWNLGNSIGSFVLNIALNVALIPAFGITGAAISWSASVLVQNVLPTWQIFRALHLHPLSAGAVAAGSSALLVYGLGGGLIAMMWAPSALGFVLVALTLSVIYVGLLWHFRQLLAVESLRESIRFRTGEKIAVESP